jgi:1-acyl-sn-glycerol-3-phosphate acyltransferase
MGAFVVAVQAGVPVVPVAIRGTRSMLRPGHAFARRGAIHITIGNPVHPRGTDWAVAVELQRAARAAVLRRCGEPDLE